MQSHEEIAKQIRNSEKLHDLFFKEMPEYPTAAWQEAIVNAVAHRDYLQSGLGIEVWLFDDRMEVESPGELVKPVSLEALNEGRRVHASRNPLIARTLVEGRIMREEGEGVLRMHEEMRQCLLPSPEFEFTDGRLRVRFWNTPTVTGGPPGWEGLIAGLNLSANQRRILSLKASGFRNADYQEVNQVDRDTAYREIQEMVEIGVLAKAKAHGRGAVYRLQPEYLRRLKLMEERLPSLRRQLQQRGHVTNRDYRGLFGVSRYEALKELKQLVDDGFLRQQGQRRGARYLPGPNLPT